MRYINADKLLKELQDDIDLGGIVTTGLDINYIKSWVVDNEVVKVSEIQDILDTYSLELTDYKAICEIIKLINPKPKKYNGLTLQEWEQLKKVNFVKITYGESNKKILLSDFVIFSENLITPSKDFVRKIKLLPDPNGFYRGHISDKCPVPGNVEVEVILFSGDVIKNLAGKFDWDVEDYNQGIKAYRILGVSDE
jgi:hypothetical protein